MAKPYLSRRSYRPPRWPPPCAAPLPTSVAYPPPPYAAPFIAPPPGLRRPPGQCRPLQPSLCRPPLGLRHPHPGQRRPLRLSLHRPLAPLPASAHRPSYTDDAPRCCPLLASLPSRPTSSARRPSHAALHSLPAHLQLCHGRLVFNFRPCSTLRQR